MGRCRAAMTAAGEEPDNRMHFVHDFLLTGNVAGFLRRDSAPAELRAVYHKCRQLLDNAVQEYLARLLQDGLLLKSDQTLPSVATLVAKAPVRGSWWAHPAAHSIFNAIEDLAARPDVVAVKLVGGKDTFVHERLWPELLAIATANEPWQLNKLPASALALYRQAPRAGEVEASGPDARLLESRLLVRGEQFHTAAGRHQKRIESWSGWSERMGLAGRQLPAVRDAQEAFERIHPGAKWPWRKSR